MLTDALEDGALLIFGNVTEIGPCAGNGVLDVTMTRSHEVELK